MTARDHRTGRLVISIVRWLCGIWAFALGARITYSLCVYHSITIPSHPLNIYFDFLLLTVFGGAVLLFELYELSTYILSGDDTKTKISRTGRSLNFNVRAKNGKE